MLSRLTLLVLCSAATAFADPPVDKSVLTRVASRKKTLLGVGPLQVTAVRAKGTGFIFLYMGFSKSLGDRDCAEPAIENGTTGWVEDGGTVGHNEVVEPDNILRSFSLDVPQGKVLCVVADQDATLWISSHPVRPPSGAGTQPVPTK